MPRADGAAQTNLFYQFFLVAAEVFLAAVEDASVDAFPQQPTFSRCSPALG